MWTSAQRTLNHLGRRRFFYASHHSESRSARADLLGPTVSGQNVSFASTGNDEQLEQTLTQIVRDYGCLSLITNAIGHDDRLLARDFIVRNMCMKNVMSNVNLRASASPLKASQLKVWTTSR